jgi:hypothetical protein
MTMNESNMTMNEIELDAVRGLTAIFHTLVRQRDQAQNEIWQFTNELSKAAKAPSDLANLLTWADGRFRAAAKLCVFNLALRAITGEDATKPIATKTTTKGEVFDTLTHLRKYAQDEVNRRARGPSHSTSVCSNLMDQEILSAWSDVIDLLDFT